ncbi:hypothetical protein TD95_004917 [Thielaviopsis punctulata]|uniref:VOC domain-containing protein n=1 Tax=Thielaviopsis punctulata TaxID=72032 RepID=A0A0F4ZHU3_9PEZI|nr:hypothetical protein TD95_004917 [Thielaviopsis punctulata]
MAPADRIDALGKHLRPQPKITLTRLLWVSYAHARAHMPAALKFYADFGLYLVPHGTSPTVFYLRGYGRDAFCLRAVSADTDAFDGAAFEVACAQDLERAAAMLPGASAVCELDAPGGGRYVRFSDPVDGWAVYLVHGQRETEELAVEFPTGQVNYPQEKGRKTGMTQRFEKRPAPVHKVGHFGVCTTDFERAFEFYTRTFNMIPSDLIHNAEGRNFHTFLRLNRGPQPVDHHCFFLFQGPQFHIHHSSFETHDFDTQVLGHDWLRKQGYRNCWGVGRHIMGSQIFDYWFDPSGFILEHYVDGDMVDSSVPANHILAAPDNLHVWGGYIQESGCRDGMLTDLGPDVPASFLA